MYPLFFLLSILPCHCWMPPACLPAAPRPSAQFGGQSLGVWCYSCAASSALAGWFGASQVVELMSYLELPQDLVLSSFKNHRAVKAGKDL